ncbi:DUF1320 domain-containing protein [Sphingomonas gilva]|uniref:DUF1320 domain-containing protein n=2 Tax=Sphingomonas gilva TaxID=2305907 RepID=A0A396RLH3_9SPHN|nr:DUF1320 domain-containing protein [Sphingomonas gilva]
MLDRFEERDLVQLTDGDDAVDAVRVTKALTRATVTIDGHVAAKYRTGGLPVPPLLTELACVIAYYHLHRDETPKKVKDDYEEALSDLVKIGKGVIKLDAGEETIPARDGAILVERPERLFGRDSMAGF